MDRIPRISPVEAEILRLLIANGEMYGLELVAARAHPVLVLDALRAMRWGRDAGAGAGSRE